MISSTLECTNCNTKMHNQSMFQMTKDPLTPRTIRLTFQTRNDHMSQIAIIFRKIHRCHRSHINRNRWEKVLIIYLLSPKIFLTTKITMLQNHRNKTTKLTSSHFPSPQTLNREIFKRRSSYQILSRVPLKRWLSAITLMRMTTLLKMGHHMDHQLKRNQAIKAPTILEVLDISMMPLVVLICYLVKPMKHCKTLPKNILRKKFLMIILRMFLEFMRKSVAMILVLTSLQATDFHENQSKKLLKQIINISMKVIVQKIILVLKRIQKSPPWLKVKKGRSIQAVLGMK